VDNSYANASGLPLVLDQRLNRNATASAKAEPERHGERQGRTATPKRAPRQNRTATASAKAEPRTRKTTSRLRLKAHKGRSKPVYIGPFGEVCGCTRECDTRKTSRKADTGTGTTSGKGSAKAEPHRHGQRQGRNAHEKTHVETAPNGAQGALKTSMHRPLR
jgi:hypothetical protein